MCLTTHTTIKYFIEREVGRMEHVMIATRLDSEQYLVGSIEVTRISRLCRQVYLKGGQ